MTGLIDQAPPVRLDHLSPISLTDLDAAAALQERVDRKYVLDADDLDRLVDEFGGRLAALDFDGRRWSSYESVYFDTEQLDCFRDAAHRRRRRCKVRTRTYLDTERTMLEVKTKGPRKQTVKHRTPHDFDRRASLGAAGREFVYDVIGVSGFGAQLLPTLTTRYRRATLVDLDDVVRLTIDADLRCTDWAGRTVGLGDRFIVETKSSGEPSAVDRWLWSIGRRPEKISKFGTGLAALRPTLPSNKWRRTLDRHFPL